MRAASKYNPTPKRYYRTDRGTTADRGYDHRWQKLRRWYLSRHPLCESCEARGLTVQADDVDHIIPFKGRSDPLRLDRTNLRALCRRCHNAKTHGKGAGLETG